MDESDSFHFISVLSDIITPLGEVSLLTYLSEVIVLILLLGASGLVSGSEVAFFSIGDSELDDCRNSKSPRDRRLAQLCDDKNTLLATILVLNNLINVAIVVLSTYVSWQLYGREEEGWAVVVLTLVVTTAIVFFGEVVPKVFAQERSMAFARFTTNGIFLAQRLLRPLTFTLTYIGKSIEDRFSNSAKERNLPSLTLSELNRVLEQTMEQEVPEPETKKILRGILNFGNTTVRQIMKPRPDIIAAEENMPFPELIEMIEDNGFSRIPVYRETLDKITGILYVKDLLNHLHKGTQFDWTGLIRRGSYLMYVSDSMKINSVFRLFQENHVHMAVVTDEYAATRGIITLEDVIEEIVGDIEDEFDEVAEKERMFRKLGDQSYLFNAKISIHDMCKIMELRLDYFDEKKGESESLGGLLLELFLKFPDTGARITYRDYRFKVKSSDHRRIKLVKVERVTTRQKVKQLS